MYRRRILSGDGRGLQNRQRVRESVLGWVRLPHASAIPIWELGFRNSDLDSLRIIQLSMLGISGALDIPYSATPMTQQEMKERTKRFALRIIRLVDRLPSTTSSHILGKQLLRSGTSVGANYRSACRAKSTADFIFKLGIVEEEADESIYWMELLVESNLVKVSLLANLMSEANEIVAIVVSSIKTSKRKRSPKSAFPNPKST